MQQNIYSILILVAIIVVETSAQTCPNDHKINVNADGSVSFKPLKGIFQPSNLATKYDAKGLQPFFDLANSFMNTVQPKSLSAELNGVTFSNIKDDEKLRSYETPIIVAIAFGLLFMLLMPLVGLCFCCCRCCGKCGGKKFQDPKEAEKHSKCFIMSVILVIVAIFMLCGVLFMFVTNNRTHDTAKNLGKTFEDAVNDVVNVATSTVDTVAVISDKFVPCLVDVVEEQITDTGIKFHVGNDLKIYVEKNVGPTLHEAETMALDVDELKKKLDDIKALSEKLKVLGGELNSSTNSVKGKLNAITCSSVRTCEDMKTLIRAKTAITINFNDLPDIQSNINKVADVQQKNLTGLILQAWQIINDIPQTAVDESRTARDGIEKSLDALKVTISSNVGNITKSIDDNIKSEKPKLLEYKTDYLDENSDYFKYENYRWYAYFGLSGLMALIVLFIALGLALGICGYNKNNLPSNRSGGANCGGNCLMAGVGFMFIFSFFLMLFCVVWYTVGIHLYLGCRDLRNGQLFDNLMRDHLKINQKVVSVEKFLTYCRKDETLFKSIGGESVFNITKEFNFKEYTTDIDSLLKDLDFDLSSKDLFTDETNKTLNEVINSGISNIDYTTFITTLKSSITNGSLSDVVTEIRSHSYPAYNATFHEIANDLEQLEATTVSYISGNISILEIKVNETQKMSMKMITDTSTLIVDMGTAESFIHTNTTIEISRLVKKLSEYVIGILLQSTEYITKEALNNLLRCKPLADLYDGLVNTLVCDDIVQNANGFWLALGWCLLFFVFAIIFSVKLAKYYRKMDYDAGIDNFDHPPFNDKIPLSVRSPDHGGASNRYDSMTSTDPTNLPFTDYNILPQHDDLLPDYEMQPPPPYQQHQNNGYNNH